MLKIFVCEVGCGELDYSSRLQVNLTSPDSETPDSSGVRAYGAHRRATRGEDVNDFPLQPAATANECETIRSSQLMTHGSAICVILSCLPPEIVKLNEASFPTHGDTPAILDFRVIRNALNKISIPRVTNTVL